MGLMKTIKTSTAHTDAARARTEGRTVYVHRFGMPNINSGVSSSIPGAAEVIETIEATGWRLEYMAHNSEDRAHGSLVLLFRPAMLNWPEPKEIQR